jgi:acetolactate synthase small subunit
MAASPEMEQFNEEDLTEEERNALAEEAARESLRKDYHPSNLAVSQALRHKHEHLRAITFMTHQFKGKVLDISTNNCIVELSAKSDRIDSFMKLIAPFGILESARTGKYKPITLRRTAVLMIHRSYGTSSLSYPRIGGRWREGGRRHRRHKLVASRLNAP